MLTIDGAAGEGGGQVLRSALALSAVTGTPFQIARIRGRRKKPGLLRQHLTAVRAVAEVCGARVSGAELGSQELEFAPGTVQHGEYRFAVGTAGSATLVFQSVLPPLLVAAGRSRLVFEGGTHNSMAPPFDFVAQTFLPVLQRMGAGVSATLERHGFYPAGGGRFTVELSGGAALQPIALPLRGAIHGVAIRVLIAQLGEHIATRELKVLAGALCDLPLEAESVQVDSAGPGNVAMVSVRAAHVTAMFTGFGEIGVRAETVAQRLAGRVRAYLSKEVAVCEHLADQLLIPLALAGGGEFRTSAPSLHTRTNAQVIEQFLPVRVELGEDAAACWTVRVQRA